MTETTIRLPPQIVLRPTGALRPNPRNAKVHGNDQIELIRLSFRKYGFLGSLQVIPDDDGEGAEIWAGEGRWLAAMAENMPLVPTLDVSHLSEQERREFQLADNELARLAGYDEQKLRLEAASLASLGVDISSLGFKNADALLAPDRTDGLVDDDEGADDLPPADPVTRRGDVWKLGRHVLRCGDATSSDDFKALAKGSRIDLVFTSPPYAQQREYGDASHVTDWDALMQGTFAACDTKALSPTCQILVNLGLVHRDGDWLAYWTHWIDWMKSRGWRRFGWYVWDQGFGLPGEWNGRLAPSFEFVFHFNKAGRTVNKTKAKHEENIKVRGVAGIGRGHGRSTMRGKDGKTKAFGNPEASAAPFKIPDSVLRITRQVGKIARDLDHPAVFPVALPAEIIDAFAPLGATIYEPFCGSGSQIIAAEKTGRRCLAMEIEPGYCDVAVARWERFTGQTAILESIDGRARPATQADGDENSGRQPGQQAVAAE